MRETLVKTEEFKDSPLGKIPEDWDVVTFEDVSTVRQGLQIAISKRFKDYKPGRYIYITVEYLNNIANSHLLEFIESPGNRVICHQDDVLVTRTGATGKIITDVEGVFHNNFFLVDYDRSKVNRDYLVCYLNLEEIQKEIKLRAGTTTIPDLKHRDFYSLTFLKPSLAEQEKIAVILKSCDETIAHTSSLIAKLKQMKAGLLHDLLTRGLDENGELRDAIGHPELFKDSPLGQIPKDWDVCPLKALTDSSDSITYGVLKPGEYISGGIPLLQIQDVIHGEIEPSKLHRISKELDAQYARTRLGGGEIVMSLVGTIGKIAQIPESLAGANLHRNLARIPISLGNSSRFVFHYLQSQIVQKAIAATTFGSTQSLLNLTDLRELLIALPPPMEQQAIAKFIDTQDTRIRTEEAYREKLKLQKQGLMHDLLTGKVRVKNA
jgi:type I restriction enzyme S subunit